MKNTPEKACFFNGKFYYKPKNAIPKMPDKIISRMGEKGLLFHFKYPKWMKAIIPKIHKPFQLNTAVVFNAVMLKITLKNIVQAVAKIIPIIAGRIPPSVAFTPAYFNSFVNREAIKRIRIKEGRTTPSVASNAPQKPPCDEPTKVAIFTAIGPGVDSATAIKLRSSLSVSQAFARQSSRISEIIPYPPPKDTAPIFKKVKNNFK